MKKYNKNYFVEFTLLFIGVLLIAFFWNIRGGKSFVFCEQGGGDGLIEPFNILAYYGSYLRDALRIIFINHSFKLPTWEMSIGYGADIITTFSYYVIGDPLTLISVFVPKEYTEILYNALVITRFYLMGISFSLYCRYFKQENNATLIGAIIYSFCGYALFIGAMHPYFMNAFIYFPLILIGVERVLDGKNPKCFIGMVALCAISNFFFFYMIGILTIVYTVFRYLMLKKSVTFLEIVKWIVKFLLYAIVGMMIASVIFLPTIMNMLGMTRLQVDNYIPLFYNLRYYLQLPGAFIIGNSDKYSYMGYTVVGVFVLITLFSIRKKYLYFKIGTLLLISFFSIPFAGHVLNGFSYVTNRWIFGFSFLMCFVIVKIIPEYLEMVPKKRGYITSFSFSVAILMYVVYFTRNLKEMIWYDWVIVSFCLLSLFIGMLVILLFFRLNHKFCGITDF